MIKLVVELSNGHYILGITVPERGPPQDVFGMHARQVSTKPTPTPTQGFITAVKDQSRAQRFGVLELLLHPSIIGTIVGAAGDRNLKARFRPLWERG